MQCPSNQNPAAHNAVLQSDFYFQQQTAESIQKAISFAQEAVRLDPNYALAYAKLSQAWRQFGASFATANTEEAYEEARKAADKAASLAPDLVEVRKAIGWVSMTPALDFRAAEKEFRRALELAPGDAGAKNALSYALMAQGRLAEAEQTCREAILLDPLVTTLWYNLGRLAVAAGRYQDAEQMFRKGLEIQPHAARFHTYLAALNIVQKNPTAALSKPNSSRMIFGANTRWLWSSRPSPIASRLIPRSRIFPPNTPSTAPTRLPLSTLFAKNRMRCSDGSTMPMQRTTRV